MLFLSEVGVTFWGGELQTLLGEYSLPHMYVNTVFPFIDKSPQFADVRGAVLVFLPGLAHIQQLYDLLSTDRRFRVKER